MGLWKNLETVRVWRKREERVEDGFMEHIQKLHSKQAGRNAWFTELDKKLKEVMVRGRY
jgi:hypothetical protein